MHVFKPGDMALISHCVQTACNGLQCIVESYPYSHPTLDMPVVDITVSVPSITRSDIRCLKYIPPEEWPEVFTVSKPVEVTV